MANVRARSPSASGKYLSVRVGFSVRTVLCKEVLEVIQIAVIISGLLRDRDEESDQEYDDADSNEDNRVLEGTPKSVGDCLSAILGGYLIVFLVPEVGEWHNQQAQYSIKAIESVVDDLELEKNIVDCVRSCPVLLGSELDVGGGRDQRHIDRKQQDGCQ